MIFRQQPFPVFMRRNATQMRSVASAVAAGTAAGVFINKALIEEEF
ncbi:MULTISPECIES: hypothetical protein [unclassified Mucilaginibacter]|nr:MULTISPECIES: hypothetical protein [unclassified Mucilaginibacter]MEB0261394.1 hypothetical protein [Mucilaginibacter sp. 10I4]MEB0278847.1 hypothetical protein [Mucilaginibacter sp. 10B2]MEB0299787.1 hypothetical protein [Mucilaginibacter sp. 5C4]WPX22029.1 hypothetical protein RHM67_12140 [Mucilaginibacter sp. 5C4]